jgi:hypothetical protein
MRVRPCAAAVLALALALAAPCAAAPADPAVEALSSDRWDVRRAAEQRLEAEGVEILKGRADAARSDAWSATIEAALRSTPCVAAAAQRVLRRLEAQATDDEVARFPRLLRARLERVLPQLVVLASPRVDAPDTFDDGPEMAAIAVRGLLPRAREALIAVIEHGNDVRAVAGAIVALCDENGGPPNGDDVLAAIVRAYERDPARIVELSRFVGAGRTSPAAVAGLALALNGRAADVKRLRLSETGDGDAALLAWLRERVRAKGLAELESGAFLALVEAGETRAEVQAEAARRALAADLPWLARLLARRATFLDPASPDARALLAKAYAAVGLPASARTAAGEAPRKGERDDPAAAAVDASLAKGRFSQRILVQREVGETKASGLIPAAVVGKRVMMGSTTRDVTIVDVESDSVVVSTTLESRLRALATGGDGLVALTAKADAQFWTVDRDALRSDGRATGPFAAAAMASDGTAWLVGAHRAVYRRDKGGAPRRVEALKTVDGWFARSLSLTADGRLVILGGNEVVVADPKTGAVSVVVPASRFPLCAATYGDDVLVGFSDGWERIARDGTVVRADLVDGGPAVGIGGDAATATIVVVTRESTAAYGPTDTMPRWVEQIGGSGSPVLAGGLVVVSAGTGATSKGGDGRTDRTIYVLRGESGGIEPFATEARVRAVETAVTAAAEGRDDVAQALLDPLEGWLSRTERWGADAAIREARERRAR